jgi:biopolymer transport protein ExbB/TolQ
MKNAIVVLAKGMSTALVTTLTGLIVSVWMKLQLVIIEN